MQCSAGLCYAPLRPLWLAFLATLPTLLAAQDPEQTAAGRTHYLGREVAQTMHWTGAGWLLRATREDEENGTLLRTWLQLQPGQAVCDLGCGNGYHTLPIAETVGASGTVYAVELQPKMLELLSLRAKPRGLDNVRYIECTVDDPKLPASSCDLVLLVDVYHELSHPVRVMAHVRRALKPGGRVVLVEFRAEDPAVPIKPEHTMSKAQMVREMAEHGFRPAADFAALPWQHAISFAAAPDDARLGARQVLQAFLQACGAGDERVIAPFLQGLLPADLPALAADCRAELRAGPDGTVIAALRTASGERLAHGRDEVELSRDQDHRWFIRDVRAPRGTVRAHGSRLPFVAMHTATGGGPIDAQADLLAGLGFDGLATDLQLLAEVRLACEQRGMDVVSAYAVLDLPDVPDVTGEEATAQLEARVAPLCQAMRDLAGGPGMLWLALRQPANAADRVTRDQMTEVAQRTLRRLLIESHATGVEIALYPHHGFWLATVEHALQLCAALDDRQLGVCFNLCHFLRSTDETDPTATLLRCGRHLLAATVNGADSDGADWPTLIRPLDEGSFALATFLAGLDKAEFTGPVGLQGYGITLPARDHLARSMAAWRAAHAH